MRYLAAAVLAATTLLSVGCNADQQSERTTAAEEQQAMATDYRTVEFNTITGETTTLNAFAGQAILVVNVASKCGYTPQYADLEELYRTYKDSGLVILGFPANNFGGQEPGSNEQILEFCTSKFDVTFPMMAKISVKGDSKHPLFTYLTEQSAKPGEIKWNFSKFVLDREGNVIERFDSGVKPMSDELVAAVKQALGEQG
jgi:glutathione peroxidase